MRKGKVFVIGILLALGTAAGEAEAQSVEPVAGGIILADSVQQVFIVMPMGAVELKPIALELKVTQSGDLVRVEANVKGRTLLWTLYDDKGHVAMRKSETKADWEINLKELPTGQYYLSVDDGLTPPQRKRIIKGL